MEGVKSIWHVEDDRRFAEAFRRLIEQVADLTLDLVFDSFEELVLHVEESPAPAPPDLVVMDLSLPGKGGLEAIVYLREHYPLLPVVVSSSHDGPADVFSALRAGARGYVVKGSRPGPLITAIREAHTGGTYFSPSVARHVLGHFAAPDLQEPLSPRELEILSELAAGGTKAVIAEKLFLSPHTVDKHVRNVYRKLHVRSAAEAAATAIRGGLIS